MTKATHTPGTWTAKYVGMSSAGDDGVEVFEVVAGGCVRVAEHLFAADANLIAASPELLKALHGMCYALNSARLIMVDQEARSYAGELVDAAEALIAKATGGDQ